MKINSDINLRKFQAWSGAVETKDRIIEEGKDEAFEQMIDELYPDGMTDTELNDLLWFDEEFIFESLGMEIEE